jgi:hypothetical protein
VSRLAKRRLASRYATVSVTVASICPATCDRSSVTSMFCARYTLLLPVQSRPKSSLPDPFSGSFTIAQRRSAGFDRISVQSEMQIAVVDVVASVAGASSGKRDARALPPQRIAGELEPFRSARARRRRADGTARRSSSARDIDQHGLVGRILEADERKHPSMRESSNSFW